MSFEKKSDLFSGFPDVDELTPSTFSSFQQNANYKALDNSVAVFPVSGQQFSGFSGFEEPEVYRSIGIGADSSLNEESFRAVGTESWNSDSFSQFSGGQELIDDSFSSFSMNPKAQLQQSSQSNFGFASAQKSKLALSEVVIPRAEPPSPPGGYLEPSYHVFSIANPSMLVQQVLNVLAQQQVDCVAKYDQFKIKCASYKSSAKLSFSVHIFSVSEGSNKRYAVEFQRRSGDALHFSEMYRSVKRSLAGNHLIEKLTKKEASSIRAEQPVAAPLDVQITVEQMKATVVSLLKMAVSKEIDLKAQGMIALSDLTVSEPKIQQMLIETGVLTAMVDDLSCQSSDVQRCCVTGIANLAHERDQVCHKVYEAGAVKTVLQLAKSETPQLARESARLLANLGATLGKKVLDSEFKNTLTHIRGGRDARAREYIAPLVELLGL